MSPKSWDTLNPTQQLQNIAKFLKEVRSRYEGNENRVEYLDKATQDILHQIELGKNLSAQAGFKMYKKLREVRRERRELKDEMSVLSAAYRWIDTPSTKQFSDILGSVLGATRASYQKIEEAIYWPRTDILKENQED